MHIFNAGGSARWGPVPFMKKKETPKYLLFLEFLVGAAGFELATPCTPCKCATRLRYAPNELRIL